MNADGAAIVTRRPLAARLELWSAAALLILGNIPLMCGRPSAALIFLPERVLAGEWWRVLTYPLAHVSWYHLLLDGTAFLQLIACLGGLGPGRRLLIVLGGGAGGLLLPLAVPSPIREVGICGLSGVDHGLMAVVAALMLGEQERSARWQGRVLLAAVVFKAAIEALTGRILLDTLHLGDLGVPVASTHLGGILGALAMLGVLTALRQHPTVSPAVHPLPGATTP